MSPQDQRVSDGNKNLLLVTLTVLGLSPATTLVNLGIPQGRLTSGI